MEQVICAERLRLFCYENGHLLKGTPKGICVDFFGLGHNSMIDGDTDFARMLAESGILYVFPYNNPWNWMNPQACAYTDAVLAVAAERYSLPAGYPLVACGGSMGGHSALVYTAYAAHTPRACVVNCPVCDLPYHYTERGDLPRTLYSAFCHEEGTVDEVLSRFSPLHLAQAGKMPRISYSVFHCTADMAVNKAKHSDRFVAAMEESGTPVRYTAVEGRGHCDLTPEARELYNQYVMEGILGA